jgi:hypothetical protein
VEKNLFGQTSGHIQAELVTEMCTQDYIKFIK